MAVSLSISTFVLPVAFSALVVYLCGTLRRARLPVTLQEPLNGLLFGAAAAFSMHNPLHIAEGVIVDPRNLFVGLAAGLYGWPTAVVAVAIACATRLHIGGMGAGIGITSILLTSASGVVWRYMIAPHYESPHIRYPLLGVSITATLLLAFLLPVEVQTVFFRRTALPLTLTYVFGSYLIATLIHQENDRARRVEMLEFDAATDPLTKLLNRRSLDRAVRQLHPETGNGTGRAMFYFDVDDFKSINDRHGHDFGDFVLKEVAQRVNRCIRPKDIFARLGGDEFLVVLPRISKEDAQTVAERCRESVEGKEIAWGGYLDPVTISIGVNWSPAPLEFPAQVTTADRALLEAKRGGRNRIHFSQNEMAGS